MKLTALFVMLMAALALFAGAGDAAPKPKVNWQALKKTGKTLKNIFGAVSAAATAHELVKSVRDKKQ